MSDANTLGADFAHALAEKDGTRLRQLLAPEIDFRAMTPRRNWEAQDPDAVVAIVFDNWFEDSDLIDSLEHVESDSFADRERVGYRLLVSNPEGRFLIEQQAYLSAGDGEDGRDDSGKIAWMRVLCSGYRPVAVAQR
jgi:hypothetical protein